MNYPPSFLEKSQKGIVPRFGREPRGVEQALLS
jgi:hypothetical protein